MNTTDLATTAPQALAPRPADLSVVITCGEAHDGRVPVTVTVTPTEDFDATGGVFVDFRTGTRASAAVAVEATVETEALPEVSDAPISLAQGDAAIAALLAREEATAAGEAAKPGAAPKAEPKVVHHKNPMRSHQIAQGLLLTVGQSESFRADVSLPEVEASGRWYVRGRFATSDGRDLKSAWLPC
ncbi:MAG: hypothetical protein U1F43_21800 [Myxococcota bacterium]